MSELPQPSTTKQQLEVATQVRDLFALAHDLIAKASHPGMMGAQVAQVLQFLKFHWQDFEGRVQNFTKQVEQEAKAELSKVDVEAVKLATEAVLEVKQAVETEAFEGATPPTIVPPQPLVAPEASKG